jgi:hypothetical protein
MSLFRARLSLFRGDYATWRGCGTPRWQSLKHALRWSFGRDSYYLTLGHGW